MVADEERAIVLDRMSRLDAREQTVLTLRYGLEGECLSLTEIGRRLGLCRVWVHEIELRRFASSPAPAVVRTDSGCRTAQPASTMATPPAPIVARCDPTEWRSWQLCWARNRGGEAAARAPACARARPPASRVRAPPKLSDCRPSPYHALSIFVTLLLNNAFDVGRSYVSDIDIGNRVHAVGD